MKREAPLLRSCAVRRLALAELRRSGGRRREGRARIARSSVTLAACAPLRRGARRCCVRRCVCTARRLERGARRAALCKVSPQRSRRRLDWLCALGRRRAAEGAQRGEGGRGEARRRKQRRRHRLGRRRHVHRSVAAREGGRRRRAPERCAARSKDCRVNTRSNAGSSGACAALLARRFSRLAARALQPARRVSAASAHL